MERKEFVFNPTQQEIRTPTQEEVDEFVSDTTDLADYILYLHGYVYKKEWEDYDDLARNLAADDLNRSEAVLRVSLRAIKLLGQTETYDQIFDQMPDMIQRGISREENIRKY